MCIYRDNKYYDSVYLLSLFYTYNKDDHSISLLYQWIYRENNNYHPISSLSLWIYRIDKDYNSISLYLYFVYVENRRSLKMICLCSLSLKR